MISFIFICFIIAIVVVLGVSSIRKEYVTKPVFKFFKRVLPPITDTEREAMEAGDVWWDGALFSGNPNWQKLLAYSKPELTNDEQAFLDNQVETLLGMLDDYQILQHDKDLPKNVWDYLKSEGFFALIIPKKYGGKEFSAYANSTIVSKIASRSNTAAITVMVPNSLGPGELLSHYGTEEQRQYWLPRLSNGEDIPCFALTGPEAGSDAGSIPDTGVICKGKFEGKTVVGIKLNWSKRYITLAPVATVLGLAFKLYDPDGLIGDTKSIGITCALIPTNHKGVVTGQRHNPLNMAFMNGTTQGKDVFVPLDWIIGGEAYAGKGWRMLVECLSAGRGISLPALSTASGHVCAKMTSAYATVRQQFGLSIAKFEGIQQAMARIGGTNYALEAMRRFTVSAIDLGMSPSVITAIAKYHMTEFSREVVNDAMDIHAGKGIQLGPKNYLGSAYMGLPVAITVEGANILTRNLMIFGQGATRCHPYVLQEMTTVAMEDQDEALKQFDELLVGHAIFATTNGFCALFQGLTASVFNGKPRSGPTARYYQHLSRMSRGFALCSDFAMMVLGGDLKRKEMLSARLGDVLSQLCIASAVLKHYEDQGRQVADLPYVDFCVQRCLYEIGQAFNGVFDNFPNRPIAWTMKLLVFPLGNHFKYPTDTTLQQICELMTEPGVNRDRHTHLCYIGAGEDDVTGVVERAFVMAHKVKDTRKQLLQAQRNGDFDEALTYSELIAAANDADVINKDQAEQLNYAEELRLKTINVDAFDKLG